MKKTILITFLIIPIPFLLVHLGVIELLSSTRLTETSRPAALLFNVVILLLPLVFALQCRTKPEPGQGEGIQKNRIRQSELLLLGVTAVALLSLAWAFQNVDLLFAWWAPWVGILWGLAVLVFKAKKPSRFDVLRPTQRERSASLNLRRRTNPVPRWAWGVAWLAFLAPTLCATAVHWTSGGGVFPPLVATLAIGSLLLIVGYITPSRFPRLPESSASENDSQIGEAYNRLHRIKCWGGYVWGVATTLWLVALAIGDLTMGDSYNTAYFWFSIVGLSILITVQFVVMSVYRVQSQEVAKMLQVGVDPT